MSAQIARIITKEDRDISRRIKNIYELKKRDLGITQEQLKKLTGWSQGYISQCMTSRVSLSMQNLIIWANLLQVDVTDIDPNFEKRFPQTKKLPIPVKDPNTNKEIGTTEKVLKAEHYAYKLPEDFGIMLPAGSVVHFNPEKKPHPGDIVVTRIFDTDRVYFGKLKQIQKTQIKLAISELEEISLPLKDIEYFHPAFRYDLP